MRTRRSFNRISFPRSARDARRNFRFDYLRLVRAKRQSLIISGSPQVSLSKKTQIFPAEGSSAYSRLVAVKNIGNANLTFSFDFFPPGGINAPFGVSAAVSTIYDGLDHVVSPNSIYWVELNANKNILSGIWGVGQFNPHTPEAFIEVSTNDQDATLEVNGDVRPFTWVESGLEIQSYIDIVDTAIYAKNSSGTGTETTLYPGQIIRLVIESSLPGGQPSEEDEEEEMLLTGVGMFTGEYNVQRGINRTLPSYFSGSQLPLPILIKDYRDEDTKINLYDLLIDYQTLFINDASLAPFVVHAQLKIGNESMRIINIISSNIVTVARGFNASPIEDHFVGDHISVKNPIYPNAIPGSLSFTDITTTSLQVNWTNPALLLPGPCSNGTTTASENTCFDLDRYWTNDSPPSSGSSLLLENIGDYATSAYSVYDSAGDGTNVPSMTISVWFKIANIGAPENGVHGNKRYTIFEQGWGPAYDATDPALPAIGPEYPGGYHLVANCTAGGSWSQGTVAFELEGNGSTNISFDSHSYQASIDMDIDSWYRCVIVIGSGIAAMYLDEVTDNSNLGNTLVGLQMVNCDNTASVANQVMNFGDKATINDVTIDEIGVWDIPLVGSQDILSTYGGGTPPDLKHVGSYYNPASVSALAYYWRFEENQGGIVEDAVSTNDLTLNIFNRWHSASNLDGVNIYRTASGGSGSPLAVLSDSDAEKYIDSGLAADTEYYYWVEFFNLGGISEYSTDSVTTLGLGPDADPTNLQIDKIKDTNARIRWANACTNEDGVAIYVNTVNTKPPFLAYDLAANSIFYPITGLSPLTTYYIWVEFYNSSGASNDVTASFTTIDLPDATPGPITFTPGSTSIALFFSNACTNEDGVKLYRSGQPIKPLMATTTIVGTTITSIVDTGLTSNTLYYYWIEFYNYAGSGPDESGSSSTTGGAQSWWDTTLTLGYAFMGSSNATWLINPGPAANYPGNPAVAVNDIIKVDSEEMRVSIVTALPMRRFRVTRGYNGTTVAYHSVGTDIYVDHS